MKRPSILFLIFISVFGSCADHDVNENSCSVANPVTDLAWLAAEVEVMAQSGMAHYLYVIQARNGSQTVFIFANCCPVCSSVFVVYNCAGERIGSLGDGEFDFENMQRTEVIWHAPNSSCAF